MKKAICFFDGFNISRNIELAKNIPPYGYDVQKIARFYLPKSDYALKKIYFFTADPTFLSGKDNFSYYQYKQQISKLEESNVKIIRGSFGHKETVVCQNCSTKNKKRTEKQTDVNIAITLLSLAYENAYDHGLLFSNDSDFAPVIKMILGKFPDKTFTVISPTIFISKNRSDPYPKEITSLKSRFSGRLSLKSLTEGTVKECQ